MRRVARWMAVGLFMGLMLPMSCGNTQAATGPYKQQTAILREINQADPRVQGLIARVQAVYQFRVGSDIEFPETVTIVRWLGRDSQLLAKFCNCYGRTEGYIGDPVVWVQVMEDTGPWTAEWVLAHELTHVLQIVSGRWTPEQRQAFEDEADGVAWIVISQMRAEGIYSMFGEDGTDAIRKRLR